MRTIQFLKYFGVIIIATFLTFFFHEFFHWIAYQLLGYDAGFTLNTASLKNNEIVLSNTERIITSAAGPIFTIIQAFVFFSILKKIDNQLLYPFLFIPFIMRLGATWANQFNPNDEGRISLILGLNLYAISSIVVLSLLALIVIISRKNKYSFLFNIQTFLISVVCMIGLVYLDNVFKLNIV